MKPSIPPDLLRTFVDLAKSGNFSKTGQHVGRSQSAISLQLKRLQDMVGSALLTTSGKDIALTEQGKILYDYAEQILRLNDECIDRLQGNILTGSIRLGIPSDFAITYLPAILGRFITSFPDVLVDVNCELSKDLARGFDENRFDLVLCLYDGHYDTDRVRSWTDPVRWVANKNQHIEVQKPLPLVLFPEGCQYRARVCQVLKDADIAYKIVYSSSNLTGNLAAMWSGLGVTALSESSIPPELQSLPKETPLPDLGTVTVALYWRSRGATKATQELVRFLSQILDSRLAKAPHL